jgi:hypothetical protein
MQLGKGTKTLRQPLYFIFETEGSEGATVTAQHNTFLNNAGTYATR